MATGQGLNGSGSRENRLVDFADGRNIFLVSTEQGISEAVEGMLDDERNDAVSIAIMAPLGGGRWRVESITGTTTDRADYDHATLALNAVHRFCSEVPAPAAAVLHAAIADSDPVASAAISYFLRWQRTGVVLAATVAGLAGLAPFLGQEHEMVIDLADRADAALVPA